MLDLEIRQAMERYESRLRDAEEYHLYREALGANPYTGQLRRRVAVRLGTWMVAAGRRLEAQNGHTEPSSNPLYVRVPQQFVGSRSTIVDCGQDGHLVIEGPFRKVA